MFKETKWQLTKHFLCLTDSTKYENSSYLKETKQSYNPLIQPITAGVNQAR